MSINTDDFRTREALEAMCRRFEAEAAKPVDLSGVFEPRPVEDVDRCESACCMPCRNAELAELRQVLRAALWYLAQLPERERCQAGHPVDQPCRSCGPGDISVAIMSVLGLP